MFLGMRIRTWAVLILSRIALNLSFRVAYPFLPAMARGLGISLEQASLMVAVRSFVGLAGIFFGIFAERRGYKSGLLLGLILLASSCLVVTLFQNYWIVFFGFVIMGLAPAVYNPCVQSYVSAHVSYKDRARGLGIIESSWSLSWLLGIPVSGVLIARWGWDSPYLLLLFLAAGLTALTLHLPEAPRSPDPPPETRRTLQDPPLPTGVFKKSFFPAAGTGANASESSVRGIWLALAVSFFVLFGNENIMIVYGAWMETQFGLNVQSLGLFSMLMGITEFSAEITVALTVDRLGKKRGLALGIVGTALSYAALSQVGQSLSLAMGCLMAMAFCLEFSVVSSFPYISELQPSKRGQWLAANYSLLIAGRVLGALVGPLLWERFGSLEPVALLSLLGNGMALLLLARAPRVSGD